jgi:hypothetical protein
MNGQFGIDLGPSTRVPKTEEPDQGSQEAEEPGAGQSMARLRRPRRYPVVPNVPRAAAHVTLGPGPSGQATRSQSIRGGGCLSIEDT